MLKIMGFNKKNISLFACGFLYVENFNIPLFVDEQTALLQIYITNIYTKIAFFICGFNHKYILVILKL